LTRIRASGNHDPLILLRLVALIRRLSPDIVMTWVVQMDVLAGIAATLLSVPWILREPASEACWPPTLKNRLRRWIARRSAAIISNSPQGDSYWAKSGVSVRRRVIANGVPLVDVRNAAPATKESLGIERNTPTVVYVGRLVDGQKNVLRMARAFFKSTKLVRSCLIVCGDGPDRGALEDSVAANAVDGAVVLLGMVRDSWSWLRQADAAILVSHYEGQPNALLEAMACGCPIIASDIGEHREILDESSALLVDPCDEDAIAEAIGQVLIERDAARARAERAAEVIQRYSIESAVEQYLAEYREVLAAGEEVTFPVVARRDER
jgi:glycosyltransferase involved in cell wall biosynthesis